MKEEINELYRLAKEIGGLNYQKIYPKLDKIGMYPGQPILIQLIHDHEGISQAELSKCSQKKPATLTTMLSRMEKVGYIKRIPDDHDRRITHLYLTEKGKDTYKEVKKLKQDQSKILFHDITKEEIQVLKQVLTKIKNNLENE